MAGAVLCGNIFSGLYMIRVIFWPRLLHVLLRFIDGYDMGNKYKFDHTFSYDQAALWMVQYVRLSACPSVRLPYHSHNVPVVVSSWNCQD